MCSEAAIIHEQPPHDPGPSSQATLLAKIEALSAKVAKLDPNKGGGGGGGGGGRRRKRTGKDGKPTKWVEGMTLLPLRNQWKKKTRHPPDPLTQTPTPLQDGCESLVLAGAPGSSSEGRGEGPLTRGQPLRSLRVGLGQSAGGPTVA